MWNLHASSQYRYVLPSSREICLLVEDLHFYGVSKEMDDPTLLTSTDYKQANVEDYF